MSWWAAAFFLARTWALEGLVVEIKPSEQTIVISHKEIPGVMPAMAMPLRVRDARELRGVTWVISGDDERRSGDAPEFLDRGEGAVMTDCRCGSGALSVSARNGLGDEVGNERLKMRDKQLPGGL